MGNLNELSSWMSSLPREWTDGVPVEAIGVAHAAYQSPGRFYHTWEHILACTGTLGTVACEAPRRVFLSLVFHDAIYVAGRSDNENLSADLARETLQRHAGLPEAELATIEAIIRATRDHMAVGPDATHDLQAAIDIDMSILGALPAQYARYADNVRREYCPAATTDERFTAGRILFLEKVLEAPRIFHLPESIERWELAARANIGRELESLRPGV
jgi:predicted metal-dependent HD superfamily phosphohydrolase